MGSSSENGTLNSNQFVKQQQDMEDSKGTRKNNVENASLDSKNLNVNDDIMAAERSSHKASVSPADSSPVPDSESGESRGKGIKRKTSTSTKDGSRKRFLWSNDLHRDFVAAIFDIGLKFSKPKILLEHMENKPDTLTTEHIKSHLQKFRANASRYRELFIENVDFNKNIGDGGSRPSSSQNTPRGHPGDVKSTYGTIGMSGDIEQQQRVFPQRHPARSEEFSLNPIITAHHAHITDKHKDLRDNPDKHGLLSSPDPSHSLSVPVVLEQMEAQMRLHQHIQEEHNSRRQIFRTSHSSSSNVDSSNESPKFPKVRPADVSSSQVVSTEDFDDIFDFLL